MLPESCRGRLIDEFDPYGCAAGRYHDGAATRERALEAEPDDRVRADGDSFDLHPLDQSVLELGDTLIDGVKLLSRQGDEHIAQSLYCSLEPDTGDGFVEDDPLIVCNAIAFDCRTGGNDHALNLIGIQRCNDHLAGIVRLFRLLRQFVFSFGAELHDT